MTEIVVVHGAPGSGKSTLSEKLTQHTLENRAVFHVSAGNRLRDIRTGKLASAFAVEVNDPNAPDPLDSKVINGVVFEYISQCPPNSITLVDGYPRFRVTIDEFQNSIKANNHNLLGCLNLNISRETSISRMLDRGRSPGEKANLATKEALGKRYDDYNTFTGEAVKALGEITPVINIDAEPNMETVWKSFYGAVEGLVKGR